MIRLFLVLALLNVGIAQANDEGLYDGVAPPGSTFVRIFNASEKGKPINSTIANSLVTDVSTCNASSYIFLPEGKINVVVENVNSSFDLTKDHFYTLIVKHNSITLNEDTYFKNRRKALVSIYNTTSDTTLDLTVNSGAVKVIEGLSANQHKEREINAVKVDMDVRSSGVEFVDLPEQVLTRGDVFSIFVCGSKGSAVANWLKWDVQPASQLE